MFLCNFATYTSCWPSLFLVLQSIKQSINQTKCPQNSSLDWRGASAVKRTCSPFKGLEFGAQLPHDTCNSSLALLFSPTWHCIHVHESTHRHIHTNTQKSFFKKNPVLISWILLWTHLRYGLATRNYWLCQVPMDPRILQFMFEI